MSVRIFASYEKHKSVTNYHTAVVNKLILAISMNSIAVLLFINLLTTDLNIPGISTSGTGTFFKPYGLANDLFYLMWTEAIMVPLMYALSPKYIAKTCKRRSVEIKMEKGFRHMTQKEVNEIWENSPADIAQMYSNYMRILLVSLVFAPLFPMGLMIGTISSFILYWTYKITFLRRDPRPPQLSSRLSENMIQWMPIVLIAYSVKFHIGLKSISFHPLEWRFWFWLYCGTLWSFHIITILLCNAMQVHVFPLFRCHDFR